MRGRDLNPRPPGYEPDELPNCSTPRCLRTFDAKMIILCPPDSVKGIFSKNRCLREKISKRHSHRCQRGSRRAGYGRKTRRLARSGGRAHPWPAREQARLTWQGRAATGAKRTEGASFDRRGDGHAGRAAVGAESKAWRRKAGQAAAGRRPKRSKGISKKARTALRFQILRKCAGALSKICRNCCEALDFWGRLCVK